MPRYRIGATVHMYYSIDIEADDEDEAWEKAEDLAYYQESSYFINNGEETGPDSIEINGVEEL